MSEQHIEILDADGNVISVGMVSETENGTGISRISVSVPGMENTRPISEEQFQSVIDGLT